MIPQRMAKPLRGKNQKTAMDVLRRLTNSTPNGKVPETQGLMAVIQALGESGSKAKERALEASSGLVRTGHLIKDDGCYSLP
jgi:hypothetical protein